MTSTHGRREFTGCDCGAQWPGDGGYYDWLIQHVEEATRRDAADRIYETMMDPDRVRPRDPAGQTRTDYLNDWQWAAHVALTPALWVVTQNTPGYLPENAGEEFSSFSDALEFLTSEVLEFTQVLTEEEGSPESTAQEIRETLQDLKTNADASREIEIVMESATTRRVFSLTKAVQ